MSTKADDVVLFESLTKSVCTVDHAITMLRSRMFTRGGVSEEVVQALYTERDNLNRSLHIVTKRLLGDD